MTMLEYLDEERWSIINSIDYNVINAFTTIGKITGLGATILNGYSYEVERGNLTMVSNCRELDNTTNGIFRLVYLEGYPERDYGYFGNLATPERTICDFLMYSNELQADLWVYDILEGYRDDEETPDNWDKVYEMMEHFNIPRKLLEERLLDLEDMDED